MDGKPFLIEKVKIRNPKTGKSFTSKVPFKTFVDSGANGTMIPAAALRILDKLGPFKVESTKIVTGNGAIKSLIVKDVEICVGRCCYRTDVSVLPDVPGDLLVGTDFLRKAKVKVDFAKGTLSCNGRPANFTMEPDRGPKK